MAIESVIIRVNEVVVKKWHKGGPGSGPQGGGAASELVVASNHMNGMTVDQMDDLAAEMMDSLSNPDNNFTDEQRQTVLEARAKVLDAANALEDSGENVYREPGSPSASESTSGELSDVAASLQEATGWDNANLLAHATDPLSDFSLSTDESFAVANDYISQFGANQEQAAAFAQNIANNAGGGASSGTQTSIMARTSQMLADGVFGEPSPNNTLYMAVAQSMSNFAFQG